MANSIQVSFAGTAGAALIGTSATIGGVWAKGPNTGANPYSDFLFDTTGGVYNNASSSVAFAFLPDTSLGSSAGANGVDIAFTTKVITQADYTGVRVVFDKLTGRSLYAGTYGPGKVALTLYGDNTTLENDALRFEGPQTLTPGVTYAYLLSLRKDDTGGWNVSLSDNGGTVLVAHKYTDFTAADVANACLGLSNFGSAADQQGNHMTALSASIPVVGAPDFTLTSDGQTYNVVAGGAPSGAAPLVITPSGGFNGVPSLAYSSLPAGITATISGGKITFTASSNAAVGTPSVTVTATYAQLAHSVVIPLNVLAVGTAILGGIGNSNRAGFGSSNPLTTGQWVEVGKKYASLSGKPAIAYLIPNAVAVFPTGQSGSTSANWLPGATTQLVSGKNLFQRWLLAARAAGVQAAAIRLGTNDSKTAIRTPTATYVNNLTAICNALLQPADGQAPIIPILDLPFDLLPAGQTGEFDSTSNSYLANYRQAIPGIVSSIPSVLSGNTSSPAALSGQSSYFAADGVHLNDAGAIKVGDDDAAAYYAVLPAYAPPASTIPIGQVPAGKSLIYMVPGAATVDVATLPTGSTVLYVPPSGAWVSGKPGGPASQAVKFLVAGRMYYLINPDPTFPLTGAVVGQ